MPINMVNRVELNVVQSGTRNDFLLQLLALQQDGEYAISAPTNWTRREPLLQVSTEIDAIVDELKDALLLENGANNTARWHFFIGSPGNGKSAAMGKLCRLLIREKNCQVRDERNVPISELESTTIPYAINVFEGDNRFASALIVQDASVVRKPFSPNVDPASELLETLESSWEKGISLVICTNRGVLEKAHRDNHLNHDVNNKPWFKIIKALVKKGEQSGEIGRCCEFEGRRNIFKKVVTKYNHLDNRSLLLERDTFSRLLQTATIDDHWNVCGSCAVCDMCPFKANRDWLEDIRGRSSVLQLIGRAEVLSGQVIVFREALAIISLLLAGCPKDYNNIHPCDWVDNKVTNHDIFSLATRRIYMSIFASSSPFGLESSDRLRNRQLEAFKNLKNDIDERYALARAAFDHIISFSPPSTDVGVPRLFSENGIFANLDPCSETLPAEFYDNWDLDSLGSFTVRDNPWLTDIELTCFLIWKELEEGLELASGYSVSEAHWALRRWHSNFLLHLGALKEGHSAWAKELDDFKMLLALMAKPLEGRSLEEKRKIRSLDEKLGKILNSSVENQGQSTIELSEAVILAGPFVTNKLKPKMVSSKASGSVSLTIEFSGEEQAVFAARMYLWLTRRAEGKLDPHCFPQELLSGVKEARVRAAAKGEYAYDDNSVDLIIDTGKGDRFILSRVDGEVDFSHE
jgi:hypothetical protein